MNRALIGENVAVQNPVSLQTIEVEPLSRASSKQICPIVLFLGIWQTTRTIYFMIMIQVMTLIGRELYDCPTWSRHQ